MRRAACSIGSSGRRTAISNCAWIFTPSGSAYTPKRISVRDQNTRWGSCSSTGTLSFSWRLILAPPFVLDYLAAHEVAHLEEMNHGPAILGAGRTHDAAPEPRRGTGSTPMDRICMHSARTECASAGERGLKPTQRVRAPDLSRRRKIPSRVGRGDAHARLPPLSPPPKKGKREATAPPPCQGMPGPRGLGSAVGRLSFMCAVSMMSCHSSAGSDPPVTFFMGVLSSFPIQMPAT